MLNHDKLLNYNSSNFKKFRDKNFIYIDKTEYLYNLLDRDSYSYIFLSRPRRFGKTLLLSTIEQLYSGNKDLFKDLWIGSSDHDFDDLPVIRLDFSLTLNINKKLDDAIIQLIIESAKKRKINDINTFSCSMALLSYANQLHLQDNEKEIIILIDEYDAPLTANLNNKIIAKENIKTLHNFFSGVKSIQDMIRCVFVTGITRFAFTSLDSGPNNFTDISLMPEFAGICGFTKKEFDDHLSVFLPDVLDSLNQNKKIVKKFATVDELKNEIYDYYDGYSWSQSERILNPYSIVRFFKDKSFNQFWFDSGDPTFLKQHMKKYPSTYSNLTLSEKISSDKIRKVPINNIEPIPALFNSGYLTIDEVIRPGELFINKYNKEEIAKVDYFSFRFPNKEIESAYNSEVFQTIFKLDDQDRDECALNFKKAVLTKDASAISELFGATFASISYGKHKRNEDFYQSVSIGYLRGLVSRVYGEVHTYMGRSDILVSLEESTHVVIEVKYSKTKKVDSKDKEATLNKSADTALKQILSSGYLEPYRGPGQTVIAFALVVYGPGKVFVKFL